MDQIKALSQFYQGLFNGQNKSDMEPCKKIINVQMFYWLMLVPAFLIIFSLAMTKPRRQKLLYCCWARPGLVYPMDALTTEGRISYAAAFGATAFLVYQIILEGHKAWDYTGPPALTSLVSIVSMMIFGTCYFPMFACLAVDCIYGYGVGTLYVWTFLAMEIIDLVQCDLVLEVRIIAIVRNLPHILCLMYLAFSFPIRFGLAIYHRKNIVMASGDVKQMDSMQEIKDSYQGIHVRQLLKRPSPPPPPPEGKEKVKALFWKIVRRVFYFRIKNFRYPARLLSVLLVGVIMLYMFTVELVGEIHPWFLLAFKNIFAKLDKVGYEFTPGEGEIIEFLRDFYFAMLDLVRILQASFYVALSVTLLMGLLNMLHTMTSFRANVLNVYKGKNNHIPPMKTRSNASLLVGFMRYAGYQVGYIAWGFFIQLILVVLVAMALGVIYMLIKYEINDLLVALLHEYGPVLLIGIALQVLQILLAKFVFLQSRGGIFALDNRRALFIFTYYMFFYNIFLGLVSCLLRIIKAIAIGTFMLPRLDNSSLSRRFQFFDPGFAAYVGYIHVECAQTHPVLLVFLRLLRADAMASRGQKSHVLDGSKQALHKDASIMELGSSHVESESERRRRAARFKWYVAYTLLNNPMILLYRKGFLQTRTRLIKEGKHLSLSDTPGILSDATNNDVKFERKENGHAKADNDSGNEMQSSHL